MAKVEENVAIGVKAKNLPSFQARLGSRPPDRTLLHRTAPHRSLGRAALRRHTGRRASREEDAGSDWTLRRRYVLTFTSIYKTCTFLFQNKIVETYGEPRASNHFLQDQGLFPEPAPLGLKQNVSLTFNDVTIENSRLENEEELVFIFCVSWSLFTKSSI